MSAPHPPPRRFTQRKRIARAAYRLQADPDPVRRQVAVWLREVAIDFAARSSPEVAHAASVATAALTEMESPCSTPTS